MLREWFYEMVDDGDIDHDFAGFIGKPQYFLARGRLAGFCSAVSAQKVE